MLKAINAAGAKRFGSEAERTEKPFVCPSCRRPVNLKKGTRLVHHFAHVPPVDCSYGSGETKFHNEAKHAIYEAIKSHPRVTKADVEEPIRRGGLVATPDVRFVVDEKVAVAIEFQRVSLDPREISARTCRYRDLNVHVLWIVPRPKTLIHGERYQPRDTERYLEQMYFGRVYMWGGGCSVLPVEFDDYMIEVPRKTYFDEDGDEQHGGGYEYVSKRFVTPDVGAPVSLLDFAANTRKEYAMKHTTLPAAKLWMQKRKP